MGIPKSSQNSPISFACHEAWFGGTLCWVAGFGLRVGHMKSSCLSCAGTVEIKADDGRSQKWLAPENFASLP